MRKQDEAQGTEPWSQKARWEGLSLLQDPQGLQPGSPSVAQIGRGQEIFGYTAPFTRRPPRPLWGQNLLPVCPSAPAAVRLSRVFPAPRLSGDTCLSSVPSHCFLSTTSKCKLLLFFSVQGKERERACSLLSAVCLSPSIIKSLRLQGQRCSHMMEGRSFYNLGGVNMATALRSAFRDEVAPLAHSGLAVTEATL